MHIEAYSRRRLPAACLLAGFTILAVQAAEAQSWPNTIYHEQRARREKAVPENLARVKADLASIGKTGQPVAWYSVPAMSDLMRLDDTYPVDGEIGGTLRAVMAQGEFEPVSFQLFAFDNFKDVSLSVSDLSGDGGARIPASELDLRVVKIWFQNGNAWISYFDDVGLKLVPELLLHDENLIKVDLKGEANYARVIEDGKEKWVWISAPKDYLPRQHDMKKVFDPISENFHDADTIRPVALDRNAFKQFFLTIHAPKGQKPGIYRGKVTVAAGGRELAAIPIAARILPFELPLPRTYGDLDKPMLVGMMGASAGSDPTLLRQFFDHGLYHPGFTHDKETVALMRKIGYPFDWIGVGRNLSWFGLNFGGRMSFDNYIDGKRAAAEIVKKYDELLGHHNVMTSYGDEQGAAFVVAHRELLRAFFEQGIKMGCAGHDALFYKGGYIYENMPLGTTPDDLTRISRWNQVGDKFISFYAMQHTGSENPQYVRFQHGLLGYLSGMSMVNNYEFAIGPFNDRANQVYRPMAITYKNGDGLMETIQWGGFREGVDDMRYATYLKQLAAEANAKGDADARLTAKKALQFMALIPRDAPDLNAIRMEMIRHIMAIRKALGK